MKSGAKQPALFYVSDFQTYDVYVYDYRSRELVGSLSRFDDRNSRKVQATRTSQESVVAFKSETMELQWSDTDWVIAYS
jgi:hypothetical protein